jgi:hypothetical protein
MIMGFDAAVFSHDLNPSLVPRSFADHFFEATP